MNRIDHVALGAASLESGKLWLKNKCGVDIPNGGKHSAMGTHNCLCQAGDDQYFEIIAIDPTATPPERARWFALDSPEIQARLARGPSPLAWIVSTDNLDETVSNSPIELGEVQELSRDAFSWRVTVSKDGGLIENGVIPIFIEWPNGVNPSANMVDIGFHLNSVELNHPYPDDVKQLLNALKIDHLTQVKASAEAGISFNVSTNTHTHVMID